MTREQLGRPDGHAFVSYVREDLEQVDRLCKILKDAGIPVWRDTEDLWPGQDWKIQIRNAINRGSFAFLACFSRNSESKPASYQREELILAAEQMRLRLPGASWLIPIRFDECAIPDFDLGAGRNLNSLQWIDLFDEDWQNAGRLIAAVAHILSVGQVPTPVRAVAQEPADEAISAKLRRTLLDPTRQLEVEQLVDDTVDAARRRLGDLSLFPVTSSIEKDPAAWMQFGQDQMRSYSETVHQVAELLMFGCAYGGPEHETLWARSIKRLWRTASEHIGGEVTLLNLRKLPVTLAIYAATLGAVYRGNFSTIRSVMITPTVDTDRGTNPIVAEGHPWTPFENNFVFPSLAIHNVARAGRGEPPTLELPRGRGYATPCSDYICEILRPIFIDTFRADEAEAVETFDIAEVYLSLISQHQTRIAETQGRYMHGAWCGCFAWRNHRRTTAADKRVLAEFEQLGENWPPLKAGLFGGVVSEAQAAAQELREVVAECRRRIP